MRNAEHRCEQRTHARGHYTVCALVALKHPKGNLTSAINSSRSALRAWAFALRTIDGRVPPWRAPVEQRPATQVLREFVEYLRAVRGNPPGTIHKKLRHIALFDAHCRSTERRSRLPRLQDIDQFVVACRSRYARATVADICSTLRGYLRFLCVTGRMRSDLAASVMAPIVRPSERPHRALPGSAVQRILNGIDRTSRCGRRDFAVLLMMSAYGLGAGEIISLTLDDIDWRTGTRMSCGQRHGPSSCFPCFPQWPEHWPATCGTDALRIPIADTCS